MPILQIVSSKPLSGKSAIAAGLALALSRSGRRVVLARAGSGDAATQDAASFAALLFASSPGRPLSAADLTPADDLTLVEADAGVVPLDAPALLVVRSQPDEGDRALAPALGAKLLGTIASAVVPARTEAVARELTDAGLRPLAVLPEERALAAPSVAEIRDALGADVLYAGENELETVEDVLIAPVYADPARPHFQAFAAAAVLAPFNKTDLHLVAIETGAKCLVITGAGRPSPYVLDRVQGEPTTVLATSGETPAAVAALSDVWLRSRFRGEAKAELIAGQLEGRVDLAALLRRLS